MVADDLPQRWLTALSQKYEITLCLSASLCPKSFVWTIGKLRYNYIKLFSYGKYFIMWWGVTLKLSNYDLPDSYVFLIEGLLHIFLSNLFISRSKFIAVNSYSCPHFSYVLRHPQLLHIYSAIWYVCWYVVTLLTVIAVIFFSWSAVTQAAQRGRHVFGYVVFMYLCQLMINSNWSNLEICKLILRLLLTLSLTNANQWIDSILLLLLLTLFP